MTHVRRADVLLVGGGADATAVSAELAERLVHVREGQWGDREVRIDPTIHRPHGRASDSIGEIVDAATITRRFGPQIDMLDVKPLRSISAVTGVSSLDA